MTTRILAVGDTHLGYRQYGSSTRREDFADAFSQAMDVALGNHSENDEPVDAVVHLGDLFHDRTPPTGTFERCIDIVEKLTEQSIPFYGIIGNHERKRDTDWLELLTRLSGAEVVHLSRDATVINDEVALYGIDAVNPAKWETQDFTLTPPSNGSDYTHMACMHQLFHPPIPSAVAAEYQTEDVLPRFNLDIDVLALGDYHNHESALVNGVTTFYPGATERTAKDQEQGTTAILTLEPDAAPEREPIMLDGRSFETLSIKFGPNDGIEYAKKQLETLAVDECVVIITLDGEPVPVSKQQLRQHLYQRGATVVRVNDVRQTISVTDLDDVDTEQTINPENALQNALAELDQSAVQADLDQTVRDVEAVAKSNVQDEAQELLEDAYADNFGGDTAGDFK